MRLLAVSPTGLTSGAERVLVRALGAAANEGWEVSCASPDGPLVDALEAAGIARSGIPELKLPSGPRPLAMLRLALRGVRAVLAVRRASTRADLVLVNGLLALPVLKLSRVSPPVVWLVHDVITRRDRLALVARCASAVDVAVCVSRAVMQALTTSAIPARVVHNGTPWPVEPAPATPPSPPVIGCNAILTSWKGQHHLLDAVAQIPRGDVVVELMGGQFPKDADYVASLEARAALPDLAGRVRFLGHVADPLARMRSWTLAVSASTEPEAAALNVMEAMSIGLPVIATSHGGVPEVMGDTGLFVPPACSEALARAIGQVLDNPPGWRGSRAPSRRRVANRFTLEDQLRVLVATLGEVARAPRDPADRRVRMKVEKPEGRVEPT